MNWAIRQKLPGTQKLVLMMLADRHNSDNGQCNPSHSKLIEDCGLVRSTVIENIRKLAESGYLRVINRAKDGVRVPNQYTLLLSFGVPESISNEVFYEEPEAKSTPSGVVRQTDGGSTANGLPPSGKRTTVVRQTDKGSPANGHKPVIEPVIKPVIPNTTPQAAASSSALANPDDVDQSVWQDFASLRKTKKAPLSKTALDGIREQANRAEMSLDAALRMCCERGWTSFKADWVAARPGKNPPSQQAETFRERDARIGREKWERMTGRVHPDNAAPDAGAIDVASSIVYQPSPTIPLEILQ